MDTLKLAVQKVVNEIYEQHGEVRPSVLLEAAMPVDSPAHDAFEWDDGKAGNEYRLIQARNWIRRVEVIIEDRPERLVHVPLVRVEGEVPEGCENFYKPVSVVVRSIDEYKLALGETLARLNAAKASYSQLKAASEKAKDVKLPNFKRADKGFGMVERALGG